MIPTPLREVARASISVKDASPGAPVKGMLRFGGDSAYFETSKGMSEIVAQNPKVKSMLAAIAKDPLASGPTGSTLVSITGRQRDSIHGRQVMVNDIKVVGPMLRLEQGLVRRGDQFFGTFGGKEVRVKMASASSKDLAEIAVATPRSQVTGRFDAKGVFEAWNIAIPMRTAPFMPSPDLA